MFIKFYYLMVFCKIIILMVIVMFFVSVFILILMVVYWCYVIINLFKFVMCRWKIVIWLIGLWIVFFLVVFLFVIVVKGGFGINCIEIWDFNIGVKVYIVCFFVL